MKKGLFLICGIFGIIILITGCRSNGTEDLTYNNEVFTESVLDSITEIDYWNGGEKIVINKRSTIQEFYGYLSALKLEEVSASQKEGHMAVALVTKDKTISLGMLSYEIVIDSKTYRTDQDIIGYLRTIAIESKK